MAFSTMGTAGGALGGAAMGAQLGSVVPGIGTAVGAVAGGLLGGLGGSGLFGGSKTGSGMPQFNPQQTLNFQKQQYNQMAPEALQYASNLFNQAANQGISFAQRGTAANVSNQDVVTPGSSAQREQALNLLNSYMQGQVPQDVQQNINRQVAQNLGGGFNLFSGGGQAPQNFARNLGQTSLGLSQYGLSAAPTWQQLANSMVVSPTVGLQAGLQAGSLGGQMAGLSAQYGNDLGMSNYQGAYNQYQANQLQNQQQAQLGLQLGQMGLQGYDAMNKANYYGNLSKTAQGYQNTIGGIPSANSLYSDASQYGTVQGAGMPGTSQFGNWMTQYGWD
jgi:hypothetical protein